MGVGGTFHHTPVGVFFGEPGERVADPYFGGAGPERNACLNCGECMTGCRHNAKNTLVKNYLHLAEQAGAEVHPLTTVTAVRPLPGGGYEIETRRTNKRFRPHKKITAEQVVFSASTMGTQKLLHKMRDQGHLPGVSDRLGLLTRTNSEALLGCDRGRARTSTTARVWRSRRRSTPTSTPTSSRPATARAPMRCR